MHQQYSFGEMHFTTEELGARAKPAKVEYAKVAEGRSDRAQSRKLGFGAQNLQDNASSDILNPSEARLRLKRPALCVFCASGTLSRPR